MQPGRDSATPCLTKSRRKRLRGYRALHACHRQNRHHDRSHPPYIGANKIRIENLRFPGFYPEDSSCIVADLVVLFPLKALSSGGKSLAAGTAMGEYEFRSRPAWCYPARTS